MGIERMGIDMFVTAEQICTGLNWRNIGEFLEALDLNFADWDMTVEMVKWADKKKQELNDEDPVAFKKEFGYDDAGKEVL